MVGTVENRPRLVRCCRTAVLGGILAVLMPLAGWASGSNTQPVDVSASVPGSCSLSSTAPPTITYDPLGTNATTDAQSLLGSITITCSANTTAVFSPDHGRYGLASGAYFQNRMYQYAYNNYLNYALYQDSGYSKVFGATSTNGSVSGSTESVVMTAGTPSSVNVYIDIPAGQNQTAGLYYDQVDFTVTY